MAAPIEPTLEYAQQRDANDPLALFRERFHLLPDIIYMDGNSLGLLSRDAEAELLSALEQWKNRGVAGWFEGRQPWLDSAASIGAMAAVMMGAAPDTVIASSTVTTNIHQLVGTFFAPQGARRKILADELTFPSDLYALRSQLAIRGGDPDGDLLQAGSHDGRTLDEAAIIEQMTDEVALIWLPSVLYRSGQLLDMERLTAAARERGIPIGFDCCHSAGVVPHEFDEWGVDFATWCSYKYLNSGPGGPAFLYVNRRHWDAQPALTGWFGGKTGTMFDMSPEFDPDSGVGKWQISTPGILGASTLRGSLALINEAGIDNLRARSLDLTAYLIALVDRRLARLDFRVGTPREAERRGGHVAVEHERAAAICDELIRRGVVPDFRPPDVIRICPSPLYGSFTEIWEVVQRLEAIVNEGAV